MVTEYRPDQHEESGASNTAGPQEMEPVTKLILNIEGKG